MAIIKCPECGKEVSDKAKQCLNCGVDIAVETVQNMQERQINDSAIRIGRKNYTIAEPSKRLAAYFIDVVVLLVLLGIGGLAFALFNEAQYSSETVKFMS